MADVFISYSRQNTTFARRLIDRLTLANKDAWVDWEGIPLTAPNWWGEIRAGIEGADSFVFIMSPASMASVVCNLELDYALALGKRIVPIVYEDVNNRDAFASIADYQPDAAMNERLAGRDPLAMARDNWQRVSHINWIFFRDTDEFDPAFERLVTTVETDLDYVKAHTRLLTRAREWDANGRQTDLLLFGDEIGRAETWLTKGEQYAAAPRPDRADVVNPLPQDVQRAYIAASRTFDRRRRRLALSASVSIGVLALVLVGGALAGTAIVRETQGAADAVAATSAANVGTANAEVITAMHEQGEALDGAAAAATEAAQAQTAAAAAAAQSAAADAQLATATRSLATATQVARQAAAGQATLGVVNTQVAYAQATVTQAAVDNDITSGFANTLLRRDRPLSAQRGAMDALVARYPGEAMAYYARARILEGHGDLAGAIADYDQAIQLDPTAAGYYSNRGNARRSQGDLAGAIADYDQAIQLNPMDAGTYANRGAAHAEQGDLAEAINDYDEAIRLNLNDATVYLNRGLARRDQGNLAGAIADFDEVLRRDPEIVEAYIERGNARQRQGDSGGAIADYDEAIRRDPAYVGAYVNRGITYAILESETDDPQLQLEYSKKVVSDWRQAQLLGYELSDDLIQYLEYITTHLSTLDSTPMP